MRTVLTMELARAAPTEGVPLKRDRSERYMEQPLNLENKSVWSKRTVSPSSCKQHQPNLRWMPCSQGREHSSHRHRPYNPSCPVVERQP